MSDTRRIPFITLSEYAPRVWVTMAGCNFRCRGCFSIAREEVGEPLTVQELLSLISSSARARYGERLEEVLLTGGEPTLDQEYLLRLVRGLKELSDQVTVQSNAHLLSPAYLDRLLEAGTDRLLVDLKAMDRERHVWYTGHTNHEVLENIAYASSRVPMVVNTLLIPGIVDMDEILRMVEFLRDLDPIELEFRINPFRAELSPESMSCTPTDEELERAADAARNVYGNTVSSRSCLRESGGGPSKTWLTVFPDGRMERGGVDDYRSRNRRMFKGELG
jgi:pyruvate-formate lyase-activating enzyme